MLPPAVILDRFIKAVLRNEPGFSSYRGKLDIEKITSPSFRQFLYLVQTTMNEALAAENENVSGGVEHPPFHFDYVDADKSNAHAFPHEGFAFIIFTLPLVETIWHVSRALSRSPRVLELLRLPDLTADEIEALHGFFFQIQLNFLIGHEYTHHIHKHDGAGRSRSLGIWTEFPDSARAKYFLSTTPRL